MSPQKLEIIQRAFETLGIQLKASLELSSFCYMEGSATNKYIKVESYDGKTYLIRINGQLWSPFFSRISEERNLADLKKNLIDTTVIYNNAHAGVQICELRDKKFCFDELNSHYKDLLLILLALQLRHVHKNCQFDGEYSVQETISSSFKKLSQESQNTLLKYYDFIISLMGVLAHNKENHVSSHNDLLPSSIYMKNNLTGLNLVDWEYSAKNHRAYDLAFFSIKAKLDEEKEQRFLRMYDPKDALDTQDNVSLMKPVIRFLLMTWTLASKKPTNIDIFVLDLEMQKVLFTQSGKRIMSETRVNFLDEKKHEYKGDENVCPLDSRSFPAVRISISP